MKSPKITIALLGFNQESFVEEAIQGIFSQDYPNLEILLSDDVSTDRTFELIQEAAASYTGQHEVKVRQNERNLGIIGHVRKVFEVAMGDWVVLAAGDDVPLSCRVSEIAEVISSDPNCTAVFSNFALIDGESNEIQAEMVEWERGRPITPRELMVKGGGVGTGASFGYRKDVASWPWQLPNNLICEDRILPLRAIFLGRVCHVDKVLLKRRVAEGSHGTRYQGRGFAGSALCDMKHLCEVDDTILEAVNQGKIGEDEAAHLRTIRNLNLMSYLARNLKGPSAKLCEHFLFRISWAAKKILAYYGEKKNRI